MPAGDSARAEADRAGTAAERLRRESEELAERSRRFGQGGAGESRTAQLLGPLTAYGFYLLHDRRWPGATSANVDHVVIGPSGVFVIDTKSWSGDVRVESGALWQGQDRRDEDVEALQQLTDTLRDSLASLGLPPLGVRPVLALDGRDFECCVINGTWVLGAERLPRQLLSYSKCLTQGQVEGIFRGLMDLLPIARDTSLEDPEPDAVDVPPNPLEPPEDALFGRQELEDDALAAAMQAPLEDWMVFLHPRQAEFAKRRFNGPALLRGSAGTGKTVVALHRMAYLAERRSNSLLFLSFVRTLPAVQKSAYTRLSPLTVDRVEFASLHGWAAQLLARRGRPVHVNTSACSKAYSDAWHSVGVGSVLDRPGSWVYWSEEVKQVIRGRRLPSLDAYRTLARTGRGSRLGAVQRETVWRLKEQYERNLSERQLLDWEDVITSALVSVNEEPLAEPYDCVVVDEVQDLTLTGVELVSKLAKAVPDSLLLVGDSAQAVFAGGVSPREAGINVTGRSTVLDVNYRNTAEILDFAAPLVAEDDDALGDGDVASKSYQVERHGVLPVVATGVSRHDIETALLSHLKHAHATGEAAWGSVAVLCALVRDVERYQGILARAGIPTVALEQWSGGRIDAVKVGTIKRAKGLEFLSVYMPEVDVKLLPGRPQPEDEVDRERLVRARRELYVAATRARDRLWVGLVGARPPANSAGTNGPPPAELASRETVHAAVPVSAQPDDVYALARSVLGLEVTGGPARFRDSGWYHQGALTLSCEACGELLEALRKPYQSGGRDYLYWALICTECRTAREPAELSPDVRKRLPKAAAGGRSISP